ncbi:MAG TPA: alcohol dehydrogenase catalytic domain-containing protein [Xanthobacteraceae bacterium]|jgi:alcohol dehydrogenase|nr:alcohol dehydrogenase catalytic domain-containing protein [Xanthobacteraceae bacterium]
MPTMIAARLHAYGSPMTLDRIDVPEPRPTDVLIEVKACGVVPNLARVVSNFFGKLTSDNKMMPALPTIFGLDPAGVVAKVGEQVWSVRPGERVYVNPARSCGSCRMCRSGRTQDCPSWTLQGYFGHSQEIMRAYPYGGLAQFITAPATALVKLPDTMSFPAAARLGYLGTAYAAMKKIGVGPGQALLINGISGQLGLNAAQLALAMGATKILGTGRNAALLDRVKALAPQRIDVHSVADAASQPDPLVAWAKAASGGHGVDGMIDCLPPGAPASAMMRAFYCLRRGGHAVNVGAVMETLPLNAFWLMTNRIGLQGSVWFTTGEGEEMAAMVGAGTLDLSALEHRVSPLSQVNEVLAAMDNRDGGFTNFVIDPTRVD